MIESRYLLTLAIAFGLASEADAQIERTEVNLEYIAGIALERAREAFRSPRLDMPEVLRQDKLDYDAYRKIRFRHDHALWIGDNLPFRTEFYHPGYLYQEPVRMFEFTKTHVQKIRFVEDFSTTPTLAFRGRSRRIPAMLGSRSRIR
jgi:glucans biosynthesis protein